MPRSNVFPRTVLAAFAAMAFALPAAAVEIPEASWDFHKAQTAIQEGDYDKAVPVLRRFAEEGNVSAQWQLGGLYMDGTGVRKDTATAAMWYRKALSAVPATIPDDPPEPGPAFRDDWNFLVLRLGRLRIICPDITARLGAMHFKGDGVEKDDVESYKWFELAKHYGHPQASVVQDYVGENLSADEIAEAERRAAGWLADHKKFNDSIVKEFLPM